MQTTPEESGIVADYRRVDVVGEFLPLSFCLFPIGWQEQLILFSFRWQLVEFAVARPCASPAFHHVATKQMASKSIVVFQYS